MHLVPAVYAAGGTVGGAGCVVGHIIDAAEPIVEAAMDAPIITAIDASGITAEAQPNTTSTKENSSDYIDWSIVENSVQTRCRSFKKAV